jgi:hypothetical protein
MRCLHEWWRQVYVLPGIYITNLAREILRLLKIRRLGFQPEQVSVRSKCQAPFYSCLGWNVFKIDFNNWKQRKLLPRHLLCNDSNLL